MNPTSFETRQVGGQTFMVFADGMVNMADVHSIRDNGDGTAAVTRPS